MGDLGGEGWLISSVEALQGRGERVLVHFQDRRPLRLSLQVAQEAGLAPGHRLTETDIQRLLDANTRRRAFDSALYYLGYRPRSEAELKRRLARQYDETIVGETVAKLREYGYLDDQAFAQFWAESRTSFSPRSSRMIRWELRRKGVDDETAAEAVAGIDDEEEAYRAAQKKARTLRMADYDTFNQRLGGFLQRKGFGFGVAKRVVNRLWAERKQAE